MYTQCPHCREAFHVTAEILQQAAGRVRCGACSHVFDALDGLSEAPPAAQAETESDDPAFRATLDELEAAGNVRIEDTGVEWRVVDDEDGDPGEAEDATAASALRWYIHEEVPEPGNDERIPESAAGARAPLEVETPTASEERYDDNTPLPDLPDADDEDEPSTFAVTPRRRAEDFLELRSGELDERQVELALGEPEEWTDLLEEVGDVDEQEPGGPAPVVSETPPVTADDLALVPEPDEEPTGEQPLIREALAAEAEGPARPEPADLPAPSGQADADEATGELEGLGAVPAADDESDLERLIDADLLRASGATQALPGPETAGPAGDGAPPHIETIIMEGELVRSSLHGELLVPPSGDEAPAAGEPALDASAPAVRSLRDTYARLREVLPPLRDHATPRRWTGLAAALLLGLTLAAQLVHAHRETLATWPFFNDTLGVVYTRLGTPITPEWDINGWQFESTHGSTDASDRILTISSSIANRSERALPYPLLHVALTDRYEEIVGGGLIEPEQYLAIRSAEGTVAAGAKFTANITIAPLAEAATGFKLNVCYPLAGNDVRCATGAFRSR